MKTLLILLTLFGQNFSQSQLNKMTLQNYYKDLHNENSDWDWTDPNDYPDYFYINGQQPIPAVFPFYDAILGVVTERSDYKKSDGWVLLYKDFGSAKRTVKMPYYGTLQ